MKNARPLNNAMAVKIGRLSIRSESGIDARRLADALPDLLRKRLEQGASPAGRVARSGWDDVTDRLAAAIEKAVESQYG